MVHGRLQLSAHTLGGRVSVRLAYLVVAGISAAGCVPVYAPGTYHRVPFHSGVLVRSVYPVEGAAAWAVDSSSSCACADRPPVVAHTATDGSFSLKGSARWRLGHFVPILPADPGVNWSVCIEPKGEAPRQSVQTHLGSEAPAERELVCDLEVENLCEHRSPDAIVVEPRP